MLAGLKRIEMDLAEGRSREALERADILLAKCEAWRRNQLVVQVEVAGGTRASEPCATLTVQSRRCGTRCKLGRRRGLVRTYLDSGVQVRDLMRSMLASGAEDAELSGYLAQAAG